MPREQLEKVVVFTGAGVSAESGLPTFRDSGGLWESHSVYDVATPEAWKRNPELVLRFYNERRAKAALAQPNAAHLAIASLEDMFDVVVITQNVDDLHERAGSRNVVHLHGELSKARSTIDPESVVHIGSRAIQLGDLCEKGGQLRPHIVWFGEAVTGIPDAALHFASSDRVLVVGTSLVVAPASGLVTYANVDAVKVIIGMNLEEVPAGFKFIEGPASVHVPEIVEQWRAEAGA